MRLISKEEFESNESMKQYLCGTVNELDNVCHSIKSITTDGYNSKPHKSRLIRCGSFAAYISNFRLGIDVFEVWEV